MYARGAICTMIVQVLIADGVFYLYGHSAHWKIPVEAIDIFLGATVVQVIGVVLAITKSLFPSDSGTKLQSGSS